MPAATVWEGNVQVFRVYDHATARFAYAWDHETDTGGRNYVVVLGVPPVNSALDAVRAAIVAEHQSRKEAP